MRLTTLIPTQRSEAGTGLRYGQSAFARVLCSLVCGCAILASSKAHASLSLSEQQGAAEIAETQPWHQQRKDLQPIEHSLQIQTLSIELDERKKGNQNRRARVYQFNYNTQHSRVLLIDLNNQKMIKEQAIASVHLPLNDQEIATARSLIEQKSSLMRELNSALEKRGLSPMSDLSLLDVKASVFEPDNWSHPCARQRCALLSLFDQTRTVFSIEPIVNLQQLSVDTLQNSP